jgi:glycosyltransferase involved in cell wall biosynthesis
LHVLYLHQYFVTRQGFTGTRSYEFARRLVARGHRVTMIKSGRFAVDGLDVPPARAYTEIDVEGIRVVPIAAGFANSHKGTGMSGYRRVREFQKFARLASAVGKKLDRPDVVYATSTPLMIGDAGRDLALHFGVPFVFEVRDVWPQALINTGALRNPLVIWWLRRMERRIYAAADHIVALSPGMKAGVMAAGVPDEKVTVITNGSDADLFRPDLDGTAARARLRLGDRFAAIYFGAMGRANGLDYVIEAARVLRDRGRDDIVLVLHGSGGMKPALQARARGCGLTNVVFSDSVPDKAAVADLVAGCDVCLTIYAATDHEQSWSPNKMFDALAAGKPVLINVPGWLREVIEQNGCGRYMDPKRPDVLADALAGLAADAAARAEMGRKARALFESQFSREILTQRLEQVLTAAVARNEAPA